MSQTTKLSYSLIGKRLDATSHRKVGEDDGGDGLDDDGGAEGEADIVAAGDVEGGLLSGLDVEGGLGSGDAGGRLEGDAEDYRGTVRDATVDSTGAVLGRGHGTAIKLKRIIMFRASHPGSGETVTELYSTDTGNGEHSVGNQGLHRIEERFAKTGRHTCDTAFYHATKRVAFLGCSVQKIVPL